MNIMSLSQEEVIGKVDEYKEQVKAQGERIVRESFPRRILELNQLLEQPPFNCTDLSSFRSPLHIPVPTPIAIDAGDSAANAALGAALNNNNNSTSPSDDVTGTGVSQTGKRRRVSGKDGDRAQSETVADKKESDVVAGSITGSKVFALAGGMAPCNDKISDIIQTLKPILRRLMEETNVLKMWITYLIPKIEDGNNFGVSIQEETLGEVASTESETASYFYELTRYYSVRAHLVTKVAKYPHLADYRRAIDELDEKQFMQMRLTLVEVRNRYSTLQDVINKNIEKIKTPRSANNVHSMY